MTEKKKILIVDDNEDLVQVIRFILEAHGYETYEAHEGIRATEMAHKIKPDVILLDINIPAGSGETVLKNLQKHYETDKIPVIIISGIDDDERIKKILAAGAKIFLQKPFENQEFLAAIESVLS
ncbi:MAG: response regulator [bacterium]